MSRSKPMQYLDITSDTLGAHNCLIGKNADTARISNEDRGEKKPVVFNSRIQSLMQNCGVEVKLIGQEKAGSK